MVTKSKRNRSPSYPVFDLETAVERVKTFYNIEGFNDTLADVALQGWGFASGSSHGYRAISALIQYGLLSDRGSGDDRVVFLTEIGKTIAIDERKESLDRIEALKEAALRPNIFQKLWDKYQTNLPSDASIKVYLIRELEFNPKHVSKFIEIYKATLEYSGLLDFEETSSDKTDINATPSDTKVKEVGDEPLPNIDKDTIQDNAVGDSLKVPIPLISGKQASLFLPIPLSEADFNLIKKLVGVYLDSMKPAIVKDEGKEKKGPR